MNDIQRMKELVQKLNEASRAYYAEDTEIMSNREYDALYDELTALEKKTGTTLSSSPTVHVGYESVSELPKVAHEYPMLSLDKTKNVDELAEWLGNQKGVLSWKMDGLTIVLTYEDGQLVQAVTRGNGRVGDLITANARVFRNVPHRIGFGGRLIIRGEAVIRYSDFNRINESLPEGETKYKNPRNLCSGTVRQLNSEITARRNVYLYVFSLVLAEGMDFENSRLRQFEWLSSLGFDVVEHRLVTAGEIRSAVADFSAQIEKNDFPSDGLVLLLDDIAYGESLGTTAKFPRNAIAFKWADETQETVLRNVEWSASRTGLINPVAVFDPVEIEGTTVSRASLHNVSVLKSLYLGIGDTITVYKANMIIPQIAENLTQSDTLEIPDRCPVCGGQTEIRSSAGEAAALYCINPDCQAKHVKRFAHFTARDAMNIEGLSEATLEKLIQIGAVHEFADIFRLDRYHDEIVALEGFGEKSYENLTAAAEKARDVRLSRLINSLGIPNVGLANAELICDALGNDPQAVLQARQEEIAAIHGVGPIIAESFTTYFHNEKNRQQYENLLAQVHIISEKKEEQTSQISGKTFVITGSLKTYANRNELRDRIVSLGGKVSGSVSKKTDYLINNDSTSASTKNRKAAELGIPVITEAMFNEMAGEIHERS